MACRMENDEQGYDVNRFEGEVKEDVLCSVCQDVPKDPRLCQNKDHVFCFAHISRHLHQNSHTCPVCRDPLTPETLRRPTGFLKNYLEDLKIKCDHHDRGCPDVVRLENLQRHVDQCGFAPVMCGNEGCETVVNKLDLENHENLCQFRITKCHDCRDIKASQDEMKASQEEMKASQDEIKVQITRTEDEIKRFESEMKIKVEEMGRKHDEMKENVDEIKQSQDAINVKVNQMKDNVDEIKQTQAEMKADQMAFEAEARNQFERMTEMLNQLLQKRSVNNNGAQALDSAVPAVQNRDVIIVGGFYAPGDRSTLDTVEEFNIVKGKSTQLPQMNHPRAQSASCVYNGDIIITGGYDGKAGTGMDSIEILKMNQDPLRWIMFDGKLPVKLSGHDAIVYQSKLYVIGGYNWNKKKISDFIYEMLLTPPYTAKLLARMSQPRRNQKVEIVNGKLFILGGTTTNNSKDAIDSVEVYDLTKNKLKQCVSLPKPVCYMSTVTWGNMIIVIGGKAKNQRVLNDVIMYDTETGQSKKFPPLIHKRYGSSAVIMHDDIVVLGGRSEEEGYLCSVESFTMGGDNWKELPWMKEKRHFATAVVKPHN